MIIRRKVKRAGDAETKKKAKEREKRRRKMIRTPPLYDSCADDYCLYLDLRFPASVEYRGREGERYY